MKYPLKLSVSLFLSTVFFSVMLAQQPQREDLFQQLLAPVMEEIPPHISDADTTTIFEHVENDSLHSDIFLDYLVQDIDTSITVDGDVHLDSDVHMNNDVYIDTTESSHTSDHRVTQDNKSNNQHDFTRI